MGDEADKEDNLRYLNYVNILRGFKPQSEFRKMGYVFLTQTSMALKLSQLIRKEQAQNNVPLAFPLGEMTTRLWLGLNRGFNSTATLKNFDVIIKAQIALAARTTQSVEKIYKELINGKNSYCEEEIANRIATLRLEIPMKPEEMTIDNEEVLQANDLERLIEDKVLESKSKDAKISEKDAEIKELKSYKDLAQTVSKENAELKKYLKRERLKSFKKEIGEWQKERKHYIKQGMGKRYRRSVLILIVSLASIVIASVTLNNGNWWSKGILGAAFIFNAVFELIGRYNLLPGWSKHLAFLFQKKERVKYKIYLANKFMQNKARPKYESDEYFD